MPTIMESLKSTKNILLQGSYTIDSMIKNLDHQETEIKKHVEFLINSKNDLTEKTKAIAAEPDLLPDTVINGAGPVDEQFFVVDAEDRALDDVLYHLDRALQSGLVDLNTFIKTVRGLARQQFKARYLKKMIVAELEKNSLKSLTY